MKECECAQHQPKEAVDQQQFLVLQETTPNEPIQDFDGKIPQTY
jgi:hypothetical protein